MQQIKICVHGHAAHAQKSLYCCIPAVSNHFEPSFCKSAPPSGCCKHWKPIVFSGRGDRGRLVPRDPPGPPSGDRMGNGPAYIVTFAGRPDDLSNLGFYTKIKTERAVAPKSDSGILFLNICLGSRYSIKEARIICWVFRLIPLLVVYVFWLFAQGFKFEPNRWI